MNPELAPTRLLEIVRNHFRFLLEDEAFTIIESTGSPEDTNCRAILARVDVVFTFVLHEWDFYISVGPAGGSSEGSTKMESLLGFLKAAEDSGETDSPLVNPGPAGEDLGSDWAANVKRYLPRILDFARLDGYAVRVRQLEQFWEERGRELNPSGL